MCIRDRPYISGSDEYKSKPAQHSVKELQGMGVSPDIIILRADGSVGSDIRRKISTFCNVKPECVIENLTMPSLYQCPLMLHTNGCLLYTSSTAARSLTSM